MSILVSPFHVADFNHDDATALAAVFRKVLGDPIRLRILGLLRQHGPLTGRALEPMLELTQPTVSHHLTILRNAGLIEDRKSGRETVRVLCVDACADLSWLLHPEVGLTGGHDGGGR